MGSVPNHMQSYAVIINTKVAMVTVKAAINNLINKSIN